MGECLLNVGEAKSEYVRFHRLFGLSDDIGREVHGFAESLAIRYLRGDIEFGDLVEGIVSRYGCNNPEALYALLAASSIVSFVDGLFVGAVLSRKPAGRSECIAYCREYLPEDGEDRERFEAARAYCVSTCEWLFRV